MTIREPNWDAFERWGTAMKNGEYQQTHGSLTDGGKRRCALGAVADLSGQVRNGMVDFDRRNLKGTGGATGLPGATDEWLGIDTTNFHLFKAITSMPVRMPGGVIDRMDIWIANDSGRPFSELGRQLLHNLATVKAAWDEAHPKAKVEETPAKEPVSV